MRRFILTLVLLFTTLSSFASPAFSWWWDDNLVTIDGTRYTTDDFKRWWQFWNDQNLPLPEKVDPYVDWLLLAREGERMDLASDPAFQRKTEVFLQVRSLLMLQKEEVYDRVKVSEADLRARYENLYTPRWLLQRLQFKTEDQAKAARQELAEGKVTIDELLNRSPAAGGPNVVREDWQRPIGIDPGWADLFRKLNVGDTTEPKVFDDEYIVYRLKEKLPGDPGDYAVLKDKLADGVKREQVSKYTQALIEKLRRKFDVKVDEERLAALPLTAPADVYGDTPIITTNRQNVTEKAFVDIASRDPNRLGHTPDPEAVLNYKKALVSGIISQNLADWESLDRNYQLKEPLKWEYQFNVNHRLTTAVENRFFRNDINVTQEEIRKYYNEHLSTYSQPELVTFSIVTDADGSVDRIWADVLTGKSFSKAVLTQTRSADAPQSFPYSHLEPDVQKAVDGLAKGETSRPFTSEGARYIVNLIDRTPPKPLPLERVADRIKKTLERQKIDQKRNEYIAQLKSKSRIEINTEAWQNLKKELGEAK